MRLLYQAEQVSFSNQTVKVSCIHGLKKIREEKRRQGEDATTWPIVLHLLLLFQCTELLFQRDLLLSIIPINRLSINFPLPLSQPAKCLIKNKRFTPHQAVPWLSFTPMNPSSDGELQPIVYVITLLGLLNIYSQQYALTTSFHNTFHIHSPFHYVSCMYRALLFNAITKLDVGNYQYVCTPRCSTCYILSMNTCLFFKWLAAISSI